MTLLCLQCINRLNEVRVAGEGFERGRIIGPYQAAYILLLCIAVGEQLPSQIVLQVAPDPLHRVQLRTIGWEPQRADILWPLDAVGGVRPAVIQEQDVEAVRKCLGECVHKDLEGVGIQIRQFQKEALARSRGYSAVDVEPLAGVLDQPYWLDATGREPAAAYGQQAKATFVLTEYPDRAGVVRRDDLLQLLPTRSLKSRNGLGVFLCDWAGRP